MRYLLLLALSMATYLSFGQQKNENLVTIYYMDGSVFVGHIVSEDQYNLKLRLNTNDTITVSSSFVKRIKRFEDHLYHSGGAFHFKKGYFGLIYLGLGWDDGFQSTARANFIFGKRWNERWSFGAGIGRESSDININGLWEFHTFTTLFGYGRYYLGSSKVRTYVDSNLGYGIADNTFFESTYTGGFYASPGFGIHFATKNSVKWHLGISQYIQKVSGRVNQFGPFNSPLIADYNIWYNRTVFRFGIEIK